ncbi:sugar isomerase domain-containing protein [Lysinibacillus sp. 54212]|uniref:sugar isomerase domain-containing protein n=1 Tax=Lysinibacillus sp. 54212 TaxID=3119829 RepID=UPI002FCB84E6
MHSYFKEVQNLLHDSIESEHPKLEMAARMIADRIERGGILQLFGCGHSHLLAQEAFYRAGGLVPVRPITIEPLTLQAGALTSSSNEKDPTIIERHRNSFDFHENDIFLVISTSGRNCAPIDAALLAKSSNILLLSLQSLNYVEQASKHKSGKRLEEIVDIVIDSHIPVGDGILNHEGFQYAPASTVIGSALLNGLLSLVMEKVFEKTGIFPVFESANVAATKTQNANMISMYKQRINFD